MINAGPSREVIQEGEDVDLFRLPIPLFSVLDGGPMITAGITLAQDEEHGLNAGIYRFLVKDRNTTGIDIVQEFQDITPYREPIAIQRWSPRRILQTGVAGGIVGVIILQIYSEIRGTGVL